MRFVGVAESGTIRLDSVCAECGSVIYSSAATESFAAASAFHLKLTVIRYSHSDRVWLDATRIPRCGRRRIQIGIGANVSNGHCGEGRIAQRFRYA